MDMKEKRILSYLTGQKLSELSLFINNKCNLRCRHCYVGTKNEESDVSLDGWKSVINEAVPLGVKIIGIVGKEPLLSPDKTFALLDYIKQGHKDTVTGFVTNGILLGKYAETISRMDIDYIDVSIEGTEKGHDYIRGAGNFQRTLEGIRDLLKAGFPKEKLFLSITLTSKTNLTDMIKFFDSENIVNFVVSPYMLLPHNSEELAVDESHYFDKFMRDYQNLRTKNSINLLIKTDYASLHLVKFFIDKKFIDFENLKHDKERDIIFTEHKINGSVYFNFLPFCTELVREIRITSDGYVLSCLDQGYPDYKQRSIGNIKENNLSGILGSKDSRCIIREKTKRNISEIKEIFKA